MSKATEIDCGTGQTVLPRQPNGSPVVAEAGLRIPDYSSTSSRHRRGLCRASLRLRPSLQMPLRNGASNLIGMNGCSIEHATCWLRADS